MTLKAMPDFDYIIVGAGASGLMLADALGSDPHFGDKQILLLDKDRKQSNDRTWCFWEQGAGTFDNIVHRTWDTIYFAGKEYRARIPIEPYRYKMIRGIDFYEHYFGKLKGFSNLTFINAKVQSIEDQGHEVVVSTNKRTYTGSQVFSSIFDGTALTSQQRYPVLQQHFIGWFVKTRTNTFDPGTATFMDFSIPQKGNTRFMYVLPFSEKQALVEYTLFSEELLPEEEYENAIRNYLKQDLNCEEYEIEVKEKGRIPMTSYNFKQHNSANLLHIGIAGGWAKASTGYTFRSSALKVKKLVEHLKAERPLKSFDRRSRFWFYDLLLLDILKRDNSQGRRIFESIFKKRSPQLLFKFLDEETNFWEELLTMSGSPTRLFLDALRRRLF
ncbi:lycopene cyclase family protein [Lentiprolixibacter aurantiacus]|uniref:Lycopene cyclase family protein n=1 Tax=Lentiprolixibacter aurantiacus TaxID=2993939 RepID=A0AAE3MJH2_9FLAO|nr:lycopene cyclase family protein [Lentiprolixibacter aurantiacus]MCX2718736.1 lycopene cyclase family protein [Lentiprolixibacter aurantiacus]